MNKFFIIVVYMLMSLSLTAQTGQSSGAPANAVAVDLGLPSGTRWANMNVGASSPEEYGGFYAWGETEVKDEYSWSNYSHCDGSRETCYSLGGNISGTQYDVAHVKWGANWRMPTFEEIEELVDNCTYTVTDLNSVQVMKLTGPNGNSVYFPFTGYMEGTERKSIGYDSGYYWSGVNPYTDPMAPCMVPSSNGKVFYNYLWEKYLGLTVRPVIRVAPSVPRTFIDLGLPSGTKWANMNVGASRPEEYGRYFAWGETLEKDSYTWDNYMCSEQSCGKSGDPVFDLVGDKADIAGTKLDAATMSWGTSWSMPTAKQIEELASNCYSSLVTINGVQCRKLVSRINSNEIIFPLAGARWFEDFAYEGSLGYYWSSTLRQGGYVSPCRLIVRDDAHGWGWSMGGENDRFSAFPIRPVYVENAITGDTLTLHKFSVAFDDSGSSELLVSEITFQRNGNDDSYSLSTGGQQEYDQNFDISKVSSITRKSLGKLSLPEMSGVSKNDLTITVDGDTISTDEEGAYDGAGSTLVATNKDGEIVYMNIASVEDANSVVGADLNAKESAITLMLPMVPNIFVAFDDEQLPHLKEMIWDVDEVKQLAAAIDRSVLKYGYTDFGEINKEATAARNRIGRLLHLDKLAEKQAKSVPIARSKAMFKASGSEVSPYIVNPYGYGGLQVEITDSEKRQFYTPYTVSGYNCEVTAYNSNRFAYSSMVKGKYDAETDTYYIPDLGSDYDYYKNILKPQKVSTFMNTFTSFKYEDLERLGQFLEETFDPNIGLNEMHWDDMKKTAYFDISAQDDAIVLLFPRGNEYMLGYNVLMSIVKPVVKIISKKAAKMFDSDVFVPFICGQMMGDPNYALELSSVLNDPDLSTSERIEKITSVSWNKFFKEINNLAWDKLDEGIKDAMKDLIDESVLKAGSIQAASDWVSFKATFKMLNWIKKYGDILTGLLGTFFEGNAVYPVHLEANGQFVLDKNTVTLGEGESVKVRILVGSGLYSCESSDEKVATAKGSYDKVEITGVDAGTTTITVRDRTAQKEAKINVQVTGIQTFALATSTVSVPMYEDRSVTIERGDGPFHIYGGDEKIAIAKLGGGNPMVFPGEKYAVVVSGVSEGTTTYNVYNEATDQTLPLTVKVTAEKVAITDERIVDLGLSVNWANCNVGASEPQEYGDYFAWGEVESKDVFSPNNYKYYSNGQFTNIGSDISGTQYDAATHVMGKDWRMPTKAEYEELISKCEWKFVTYRKVRGWKVTGPSGNSIFLPATGYVLNDWNEDVSINGFYWSSNVTDNLREVYTLFTSMNDYTMYSNYMNRFEGRTIRAVTGAEGNEDVSVQTETFTIPGTDVSFKMIGVEGGTFWMGAADDDEEAYDNEKPRHQVTLSSFAIGETEVTQALWEAVMGSNPSYHKGANYPLEGATWNECLDFISKLNTLTGRQFRLPTEAEWEYAARGGKNTHGYKYSGSNNLDVVGWYGEIAYMSHAVAQKQPNELGLYDMSGNVNEWCQDLLDSDYYNYSPAINPCNTTVGTNRIARGGGWHNAARVCRVSTRPSWPPEQPDEIHFLGLRLALSDGGSSPQAYLSCPDGNHPHMIDLGLPSGTKWACCNVGADKPEAYGGYYAWGETEEKDDYDWGTYKWCDGDYNKLNKYCIHEKYGTVDNKTMLDPEDDVANVKWGGGWRMPSSSEIAELSNNCKIEIVINGRRYDYYEAGTSEEKDGFLFIGPNGNILFLPAAGMKYYMYPHESGKYAQIWSSNLYVVDYTGSYSSSWSDGACFGGWGFDADGGGADWNGYTSRDEGKSVRPVIK